MTDLSEHFAAGDATDLPGHCKWCGAKVESEEHLMRDPLGTMDPICFCSARCLNKAESIFDGLSPEKLEELDAAIAAAESQTRVKQ